MKSTTLCSCIICKSVKSVKGIFTHYKIAHTDYKENHSKISRLAGKSSGINATERKKNNISNYNLSPNLCENCKKPLSYNRKNNKFCSNSCSAKFNNIKQSSLTKQKKSFKMSSNYFGMEVSGEFCPVKIDNCKWCKELFVKRNKEKYCSSKCRSLFRKDLVSKLPQETKDKMRLRLLKGVASRCIRSKDEISLYNLCYNEFQNVTHNTQIIDGWDADILLHDYKIAILWNGPWHYKEMPLSNHSLKQVQTRDKIKIKKFTEIGWQVLIYEDRYFTVKQAFDTIKMVVAAGIEPAPNRI